MRRSGAELVTMFAGDPTGRLGANELCRLGYLNAWSRWSEALTVWRMRTRDGSIGVANGHRTPRVAVLVLVGRSSNSIGYERGPLVLSLSGLHLTTAKVISDVAPENLS